MALGPYGVETEGCFGTDLLKTVWADPEVVAFKVQGKVHDIRDALVKGTTVVPVLRASSEGTDVLRHSASHVMSQAVEELWPEVQFGVGPVTETGFFQDIRLPNPLSSDVFSKIEEKMRALVAQNLPIERHFWTRDQAKAFFAQQPMKLDLIDRIPENEAISVYVQGNRTDLCEGPHVLTTAQIGNAFQLTTMGGAHWHGETVPSLQRIYGTAWATEEDLQTHKKFLKEAEERDHRRLGQVLDLFHFQNEAPGDVFWHPKGWQIYRTVVDYMRTLLVRRKYQEVNTPQFVSNSLWKASGHWDKYHQAMFTSLVDDEVFCLKPMSCPCHVQIFNNKIRSYRDLPYRLGEFGAVKRYEPSGSLMGLMRVRAFTQDDGHVFCSEEQIVEETKAFCAALFEVYTRFGFQKKDIEIRLATRPDERHGSDEVWDRAEAALRAGSEAAGLSYTVNPGEGAFYGPKLEFVLKDVLGRRWQCGTWQVDFVLPGRLGAKYIGADGQEHVPVMLHQAITGSIERFIGILLENTGGRLPLWLAPLQITVATLNSSDELVADAETVALALEQKGFRVDRAFHNKTLPNKIFEWVEQKIPHLWVIGRKESENGTVSMRIGRESKVLARAEAYAILENERVSH